MIFIGTEIPNRVLRFGEGVVFVGANKFSILEEIEDSLEGPEGKVEKPVSYSKVLSRKKGYTTEHFIIDAKGVISTPLKLVKRLYGDVFYILGNSSPLKYIYKNGNCASVKSSDYLSLTDGQDYKELLNKSSYSEHSMQKHEKNKNSGVSAMAK